MPIWIYFAMWLVAALLLVALLSAGITKHLKLAQLRRKQAVLLLDALERYGAWVAQQRYTPVFFGETADVAEALDEATLIRMGWFPELGSDMAELLGIHGRLLHFLASQHALRLRDPEGWIETEHDARFLALWRQLNCTVGNIQVKLSPLSDRSKVEEVIAGHAPLAREISA